MGGASRPPDHQPAHGGAAAASLATDPSAYHDQAGLRLAPTLRAYLSTAARHVQHFVRETNVLPYDEVERVYRPTTAEPPPAEPPAALEMPEWVAQLAHDIRSPLTSMLFLVQSLRDRQSGSLNEIQERQIALLYGAVFNLSSIANDVIEMSRAGSHRLIGPEPVVFSMSEVLHCVREIVLPITEERGIELHVVTPAADMRIGHPLALSRILLNLTVNALRFTQKGSVEMSVRECDGGRVECAVTDTGPGITPGHMAAISGLEQWPMKGAGYGSTSAGLGLAICRQLLTTMGSELQVESREGLGSRFWFVLDAAPAAER